MDDPFEQARKDVQERFKVLQDLSLQLTVAYHRDPKGAEVKRLKKQLTKMGATVEFREDRVGVTW